MAHAKTLSAGVLNELTKDIGGLVARHDMSVSSQGPPVLAESFEIFALTPRDIKKAVQRRSGLRKVIRKTGQWHHQIGVGGEARGFARSIEPKGAQHSWSVGGVFVSELASKIEAAVQRIDTERPDESAEVRLVDFPGYHMHFFLIESPTEVKAKPQRKESAKSSNRFGQREVFVIASPFSTPGLEEDQFYSEQQFLQSLLRVPFIRGVIHKRHRRKSRKN